MSSQHVLVLYGTHHGQTAKVARRIADALTAAGDVVTLVDIADLPRGLAPRDFDRVMIGGSVQYGRHQRRLRRFVRTHLDGLNTKPTAFFSVSGAAAGRGEEQRASARGYVDEFLRETGWHPGLTATIGGSMAYTKYNPLLRWITKRAAAKAGGPVDASRDYEMTDWAEVQRFAESFAAMSPALS